MIPRYIPEASLDLPYMGNVNLDSLAPTQPWAPPCAMPDAQPPLEEIEVDISLPPEDPFVDEDLDRATSTGRFRVFHFRCNDLTDREVDNLKELLIPITREFVIGQQEIGQFRGTKHHHVHIHLMRQHSLAQLKRVLQPILLNRSIYRKEYYLAPAKFYFDNRYTEADNREYATKNGIYFQHVLRPDIPPRRRPTPPSSDEAEEEGNLDEHEAYLSSLKYPLTMDDVDKIHAIPKAVRHEFARKLLDFPEKASVTSLYETMHKKFGHLAGLAFFQEQYYQTTGTNIRKLNVATLNVDFPSADEQEIVWITGPAGTGKTTFVNLLYPNHYVKNKDTQFWESYNFLDHSVNNPHMCVVFNELDLLSDLQSFSANGVSFDAIKNMLDIRPFPIEIKHKNQELIRPRRIYITSNTDLRHICDTAHLMARHDNSSNKIFRLDAQTLYEALNRRVKTVHVDELLETYGVFCIKDMKDIPFGGIFPLEHKGKIRAELLELIDLNIDVLELHDRVASLRKKWEKTTVEYLSRFRWKPYSLVKTVLSNSFDVNRVRSKILEW